jgi:ribosomal protein S14
MKYIILKDRRRRIMYYYYENSRNVIRSIIQNMKISTLVRREAYRCLMLIPRDSSITRLRNRCTLTGRARGIYRKFKLSRLMFRKLA